MPNLDLQDRMNAYLLGELSDEEQAPLEDLYFADDAAHQELLAAEDELIDSYARGELRGSRRERFERLFLGSARRREKLALARELLRVVENDAPVMARAGEAYARATQHFGWRFAFLASAASLVAVLGVLMFHQHRLNSQAQEARAERDSLPKLSTPAPRESVKVESPEPARRVVLALKPSLRGEGESNRLVVRSSTESVRLEADLEGRLYQSYEVILQDAAGRVVWRQDGLVARGRIIECELDARLLAPGGYAFVLFGRDARGTLHLAAQHSLQLVRYLQ